MAKGLEFQAKLKLDFFDAPAVKSMLDEKERRLMFKVLGDARRGARREIKIAAPTAREASRLRTEKDPAKREKLIRRLQNKRKRVSRPGDPPISHTRDRQSIRWILFHYDRARHTGVVGPAKFNAKGRDVPATLAGGGAARIKVRRGSKLVTKTVRIAPRPIPSLLNAVPRFTALWKE